MIFSRKDFLRLAKKMLWEKLSLKWPRVADNTRAKQPADGTPALARCNTNSRESGHVSE
jgi:hypothetical protein